MTKLQEKAVTEPLGIYLHVPFCARSCDFCHFYQELPKREDLLRYLRGMEMSMRCEPPVRYADTAFWGGGTPGLLPPDYLARLCEAQLAANADRNPVEWTVEMAPATVKADKLQVLLDHGVNRISLGVQSFNPRHLESLGRIHSLDQVWRALELMHAAGVPSINLDLIFAIPGQTIGDWEDDLATALSACPDHISTYCLTFEEDTALWLRLQRGQVRRQSEADEAAFFQVAWDVLGAAGLQQYEISNYARPGHACRHNIHTWQMAEWLGYGPSASSQLGDWRWTEAHSLPQWLAGIGRESRILADRTALTGKMLAEDALVFGLRMNHGIVPQQLRQRFGTEFPAGWDDFAAQLIGAGYAAESGGRFSLTASGRLLADRIGSAILELN